MIILKCNILKLIGEGLKNKIPRYKTEKLLYVEEMYTTRFPRTTIDYCLKKKTLTAMDGRILLILEQPSTDNYCFLVELT